MCHLCRHDAEGRITLNAVLQKKDMREGTVTKWLPQEAVLNCSEHGGVLSDSADG